MKHHHKPTHEIPPVEVAPPIGQILPSPFGVRRRRVTIVSPGQPIPYGRPYRYHPKRPVHMMTSKKRVGPLPTHRLVVRHSVDYSSSGYFTFDDSSRDSPSDSSSEMSSDSYSDALSDSSSGHSSSYHSSPALPLGMRSSHQLCSSVPSIPHSSAAITERPSHSSSAGPSHKRSRDRFSVLHIANALERRIDARVVVETVTREEVETSAKGTIKSAVLSERISELERDNMRLRGTLDVASQRVTRIQRRELRVQREIRQIRRLRFYDHVRIARLEACARRHLGYRP
ncbi:hypothetical protein Tco_0782490 [Tanacetum coccineum]